MTCANRLIYYSDRSVTEEEYDPFGTGEDARRPISFLALGGKLKSENFEAYRQILLRILPDSLDQLLRVGEQLIAVVIKCRVMQEPASGTFAFVQSVGNIG
jgi:hypothetical protein